MPVIWYILNFGKIAYRKFVIDGVKFFSDEMEEWDHKVFWKMEDIIYRIFQNTKRHSEVALSLPYGN